MNFNKSGHTLALLIAAMGLAVSLMFRHLTNVGATLLARFGIILLCAPLVAAAQQYGDWVYTTNDTAVIITGYTGLGGSVTIPSTIYGMPVTSIGGGAFTSFTRLTSVTIPNGVLDIGNNAFAFCSGLASATLPDSLTSIGHGAFYACSSLSNIAIPINVTNIVGVGFNFCSSLTNVTIWSGSLTLGGSTFAGCYSLTSVFFMGNAPSNISDHTVFAGDTNATVYYLPETTGWGAATFDGLPTMLWSASPTYTINLTTNGQGSVTISPQQASYTSNSIVTITALPTNGYSFVGWTGDLTSSTNILMVTLTNNLNLTANFVPSGLVGQPAFLTNGLVAYYPFNGNVNDESGNNFNGVINGVVSSPDRFGRDGKAYRFNGVDSYVQVSDGSYLQSVDNTISIWFFAEDWPTAAEEFSQVLISKGQNNCEITIGSPTTGPSGIRILPRVYGPGLGDYYDAPTGSYTTNRWNHLVVSFSPQANSIKLFVNGVAVELSGPETVRSGGDIAGNMRLGTRTGDPSLVGNNPFMGLMDDIRIYNRALSDQEVKDLYTYEAPPFSDGLVAYYPFNGNANDASGNGNNGTANGATLTTDRFGNTNRAYSFNGTSYIQCPDAGLPSGNNPRTVCLWMNIASFDGLQITYPFGYGVSLPSNAFYLCVDNLDAGGPYIAVGPFNGGNTPKWHGPRINVWYHVAVTYTNSNASLYVNGSNVSQTSRSYATTLTGNFFIGGNFQASLGPPSFVGAINDVRIYNRALSDLEVKDLYNYESTAASEEPGITSQPQSVTNATGATVSFSVTATGTAPLNYQWQKDGNNLTDVGRFSGVTTTKLTIRNVQNFDAGTYRVVVGNVAGSTNSQWAILTVTASSQPNLYLRCMAMGYNYYGQLGDGTTTNRSTPVQVATGVATVAAGGGHSLFVKTDGTLWAVGGNGSGPLGDGTTTNRSTPVQVATDVASVAAGGNHSLFVKNNGTLWAMGYNYYGQLGDGTTTNRSTPVQVATDVVSVAAGVHHSLFMKTDGTLWAMGKNGLGQLGDGTLANRSTPVQVATDVASVAAGGEHSLFMKTDGTLWAMGDNYSGQLGDGTTANRSAPVQVAFGVATVTAGWEHSLFLKTDGTLWAMGDNSSGQLGDGTTTNRTTPVQVATDVVSVAAGAGYSLFVVTDGTLWTMGDNYWGQLGGGTKTNRSTPMPVASGVASVAAGMGHTLFLSEWPPVIVAGPVSQSVNIGNQVKLTVTASGAEPLSYQWQRDGTNLIEMDRFSGATTTNLTIANFQVGDTGNYSVIVSNEFGSITSAVAWLEVLQSFAITVDGLGQVLREPEKPMADYTNGDNVTLTAQPARYFAFSRWADGSPANPRSVVVGSQPEFKAIFVPTQPLETNNYNGTIVIAPVGMPAVFVDGQYVEGGPVMRPEQATITLHTSFPGGTLFYTLDNTEPGPFSDEYLDPITITNTTIIHAVAYNADLLTSIGSDPIEVRILPAYMLVATTAGGGSVTADPPASRYMSNTVVTLTATPASGWTFVGWTDDASGTTNSLHLIMDRAQSVTAVFGTPVALTAGSGGAVQKVPDLAAYPFGSTVRLVALPSAGQGFARWGNAASGTASPFVLTVTNANPNVSVLFAALGANQVALTLLLEGEGMVTSSPAKNVFTNGQTVILTAQPVPGQTFNGWSGDATGTVNPLTLTMDTNKTITARFSGGFVLTTQATHGRILRSPDQTTFPPNTIVRLTAVPDDGYVFIGWGGDAAGTVNPLDVTLDGPKSVRADFAPAVQLNIVLMGRGQVTKAPDQAVYIQGTRVRLTAEPDPGFAFVSWSGDAVDTANPFDMVLDTAKTVTATFRDMAGPTITIESPVTVSTNNENIVLAGTVTDNVGVASLRWERDGLPMGTLSVVQDKFRLAGLRLARGDNHFRVVAADAAGNESSANVTVTWTPNRTLSVIDPTEQQEGKRLTVPLTLASAGEVSGLTFTLNYDPAYLRDPLLEWSSVAGTSLNQVNTNVAGQVQASFSLAATTIPAGTQLVANVSFRARSVPSVIQTELALEIADVTDSQGEKLLFGTDTVGGQARILARRIIGDNNANNRLDIGDATVVQRLVTHLEEVRSWDVSGNDINASGDLDSGDVTKVLRVVVGLDPQPKVGQGLLPAEILENHEIVEKHESGEGEKSPYVGAYRVAQASVPAQGEGMQAGMPAPLPPELALLVPTNLTGKAGDLVTVQVVLQDIRTALSGASLNLLYPTNALRLLNGAAQRTGSLVPGNAVAVWNVAPAQNDYLRQTGLVALAVSSATVWPASNGVLAELTFQVQPGYADQAHWPVQLTQVEITDNGYDIRTLPEATAVLAGVGIPTFRLEVLGLSAQGFQFKLMGEVGVVYELETSTNLNLPSWQALGTLTNGGLYLELAPGKTPYRFYRAVK